MIQYSKPSDKFKKKGASNKSHHRWCPDRSHAGWPWHQIEQPKPTGSCDRPHCVLVHRRQWPEISLKTFKHCICATCGCTWRLRFEWIWMDLIEIYRSKYTTVYSHLLAWCFWQVSAVQRLSRCCQYDLDSHSICFQHEEPESVKNLASKCFKYLKITCECGINGIDGINGFKWSTSSRWFFASKARRALMASPWVGIIYR